jgi:signal transduction histidine kinase
VAAAELLPGLLPGQGLEATASLLPDSVRIDGAVLYRFDAGRSQLVKVAEVRSPDSEFDAASDSVELDSENSPLGAAHRGRQAVATAWASKRQPGFAAFPLLRGVESVGVLGLVPTEGSSAEQLLLPSLTPLCACVSAWLVVARAEQEVVRLKERAERAQRELSVGRALVDSLVEGSDDGFLLVDLRGRIRRTNAAFAGFLGLTPPDLVGLRAESLAERIATLAPLQGGGDIIPWSRSVEAPKSVGRLLLKAPTERVLFVRATPIRDQDHQPSGTLFIARDETRHESSNRMKTEFVATVSHELRTPLTSLHGALRILESLPGNQDDARPEQGHFLGMAVRNTERLIRLLDDILDVERIEQGRVELNPQRFTADDVLRESVEEMRGFANDRGVQLRWYAPAGAELVGDRDRIQQVLVNLLSNAIKFSREGEAVSTRARVVMQGLRFSVQDRGPGIPADEHERIFERFRQGDSSTTRSAGGTGLGLAISKAIIQEHGGRIWLRSVPGQGSTFYFQIPLSRGGTSGVIPLGEDLTDDSSAGVGD